mmetsp:Transcript_24359/g.48683  ORF Transcript_24359/g.48683 Transcript_24359/m.48683 type:complete len:323 (+) Transcript_24359:63-1031(+)|eukprot:CAMPEP_0171328242 /NCGR_PEP_ID=MMETSP0878-20121228/535_1 /TAXON_ID=67004 /ORGANISM="Thalassiosira weissflogii, Strain CCMP1336" /LENGTH=322 /DNA_ID=CAMNT_0011828077 /DNA_START=67 /DNA_END=1035 /DNA_ORIENTATION=+
MSFQRVALLASLLVLALISRDVSAFAGFCPLSAQRLAQPAATSKTAIREGPELSASEKAGELKRKAEEAKRKAEELKKVAEAKAAAAMMAVKRAKNGGVASEVKDAETAAEEVIDKESAKMSAKAEALKEDGTKASTRVVSDESAIIPINEATIEFTAGVIGGVIGLAFTANPVFAVVTAAAANYISKKDDLGELNELVQSISKASLSTYNWFAKLDAKYMLLGKITESLDSSLENLKKSGGDNSETIAKIERALSQTTKQLKELAEEADLVEGSKQALGAVGEIIETGVDKTVDANKQYKLTERAANAAKTVAKKSFKSSE